MQGNPIPTPQSIGAAPAAQGLLAATALQPEDLAGQIRAWAIFDGRVGGAISSSANVISITRTGTGQWTALLSVSSPSASFVVMASCNITNVSLGSPESVGNGVNSNEAKIFHFEGGVFADSPLISFIAVW